MEGVKDRYIKIQDVAKRMNCTDQYVYALIREGKLTAIKIGERALRIAESSFDEFIAANIVNPDDYFAPADPEPETKEQRPGNVARSLWMNRR